jgi:hypothetical protein
MELKTVEKDKPKVDTQPVAILKNLRNSSVKSTLYKNPVLADIMEEAGEEVYSYLEKFKLTEMENILFLPSVRHYLYNSEELKLANSVINFKLLNRIPHIRYFLVTMNRLLPIEGLYVGCFLDYKKQKQRILKNKHSLLGYAFLMSYAFINRAVPRIPVVKHVQHLLNSGKVKCITREEAKLLLEKNGFKIINMSEIDGLTYYICKKVSHNQKRVISLFTFLNSYKNRSQIINT